MRRDGFPTAETDAPRVSGAWVSFAGQELRSQLSVAAGLLTFAMLAAGVLLIDRWDAERRAGEQAALLSSHVEHLASALGRHGAGSASVPVDESALRGIVDEFARLDHLEVRLTDDDGRGPTGSLSIGQGSLVDAPGVVSRAFDVGAERWRLRARSTSNGVRFPANPAGVVLGLAVSAALGIAVWLLLASAARLRRQNRKLVALAATDPLTGALNRRFATELCERELLRARRAGRPFSIVLFDLDHFKQINDTYGHMTGDAVLRGVCDATAALLRRSDVLARWGGEEFIVVAPETDAAGALHAAERLRQGIEALSEDPESPLAGLQVTASFGVATFDGDEDTDSVFERADRALYRAKSEGRNQSRQSEPDDPRPSVPSRRSTAGLFSATG
jgi:diguanylate cyclase (GGDEF)-like protein